MAWDQAIEWSVIGPIIRHLGAFPVKQRTSVTKSAVAEALWSLKDGAALIVFPEGEREFSDGKMLDLKSGALHIATLAEVPILPVTIRGANKVWPRGQKYPRLFRRLEIIFHPPMDIPTLPEGIELREHLELINEELARTIGSEL
jgi:1-acyl-sn-glycerol-3-phosphate acyltransferase